MANGKTETDTRYVALSRKLTADKLAEVMRAHWGIENQLNWILDVVFDEDAARTRKDYGPENLAVIRRLARTSCECTRPMTRLAEKCVALRGAKTSSSKSLLICADFAHE
jgi:hypothetical protein